MEDLKALIKKYFDQTIIVDDKKIDEVKSLIIDFKIEKKEVEYIFQKISENIHFFKKEIRTTSGHTISNFFKYALDALYVDESIWDMSKSRLKITKEFKIKLGNKNNYVNKENEKELISIIGYNDIKEDILDQLESIINSDDAENWGLKKPGGILLFGPPGCGKTHWANWLATFLKYEFQEVPRSVFGSTFVDGAMLNLKKLLNEIKEKSRLILFFDEFDSIAGVRNKGGSSSNENDKVVNTLLQEIPKLIENDIIIVAASNFLESLDPAVIRPGRFDLKLPIFPPTPEERIKLLIHTLSNGLKKNSPLLNILSFNEALDEKFWLQYSKEMELFSNSLVIDASEIIKKRIKKFYSENDKKIEIEIPEQLIKEAIADASAKLTKRDAEFISNFYNEVKALGKNVYNKRTEIIFEELSHYYKRFKNPPKPIGYRKPDISI